MKTTVLSPFGPVCVITRFQRRWLTLGRRGWYVSTFYFNLAYPDVGAGAAPNGYACNVLRPPKPVERSRLVPPGQIDHYHATHLLLADDHARQMALNRLPIGFLI